MPLTSSSAPFSIEGGAPAAHRFCGRQSHACLALWSLVCCCLVVRAVLVCVCARERSQPCARMWTCARDEHDTCNSTSARAEQNQTLRWHCCSRVRPRPASQHAGSSSAERARQRGRVTHAALVGILAEFLRDTALGVLSHVHCVSECRRSDTTERKS